MENFTNHMVPITILAFLFITFLQSGLDKALDWKNNVDWLKGHFEATFLGNTVPFLLGIILVLEIVASVFCGIGIVELLVTGEGQFAIWGAFLSCLTLLALLFGQRVAKDYAGALTITCYFIVAIFGLYIMK